MPPETRSRTCSVQKVLKANASVPWVQRALNPEKYPMPEVSAEGEIMTHRMAAEIGPDGKAYAFPTVVLQGNRYVELPLDQAMDRALKTGDFIKTDKIEKAIEITKKYKGDKFKRYYGQATQRMMGQE
jgi:hypothetical protein